MGTVPNHTRKLQLHPKFWDLQYFLCDHLLLIISKSPLTISSLFSLGKCQNTPKRKYYLFKFLVELERRDLRFKIHGRHPEWSLRFHRAGTPGSGSLPSAVTELPWSPRGGRPHWRCQLWRGPTSQNCDNPWDHGPAVWRTGSWCSSQVSGLCHWGGRAKFRTLVHKRPPSST